MPNSGPRNEAMIPAAESSCLCLSFHGLSVQKTIALLELLPEKLNPPTAKTPFIPGTVLTTFFDFCNNVARVIKGNPVRTLHDNHEIADVFIGQKAGRNFCIEESGQCERSNEGDDHDRFELQQNS